MTKQEASERYRIPVEILDKYESWGLCGEVKKVMGHWRYDHQDLEQLSMIMALHDIGFSNVEVERYMRLAQRGNDTSQERMRMLNELRSTKLEEIHLCEQQLNRMDYLRHKIQHTKRKDTP